MVISEDMRSVVEKKWQISCQTNATGTIKADTAVSFVNTKNGSVPTLADMNTKIPFVLVILAIGGVGFLLWKKHKSVKE